MAPLVCSWIQDQVLFIHRASGTACALCTFSPLPRRCLSLWRISFCRLCLNSVAARNSSKDWGLKWCSKRPLTPSTLASVLFCMRLNASTLSAEGVPGAAARRLSAGRIRVEKADLPVGRRRAKSCGERGAND